LVATRIALDLDYIGAKIPKQHCAIGAGQSFREFDNSDPVEAMLMERNYNGQSASMPSSGRLERKAASFLA